MRLYKFAPLALLLSLQAHAAPPVITGASGHSGITLTGTPVILGGYVGTSVAGDGSNTVNTCTGSTSTTACNTTSIYGSLQLRVTASHTDSGNLVIATSANRTNFGHVSSTSDAAVVTWDTLCQNFTTSPGLCDSITSGGAGNFKIYVDKNLNGQADADEEGAEFSIRLIHVPELTYDTSPSEGPSSFKPYPGDEKVYIEDPTTYNGSVTLGYGSKAVKLRVFISPNNMTEAMPGTGLDPQDLTITSTGGLALDSSVVDGLTNGQLYFFRVALVDEANNVVLYHPANGAYTDCDSGQNTCIYSATPDEVIGMLTEDLNCFVATAAFGSALEPKLNTFREFRFKQLLPHKWGRSFVKWYYHYGPYVARYIHDKPVMRAGARVLLWPAYGFSRIALAYGIYPAFVFTLAILSVLAALPFIWARSRE